MLLTVFRSGWIVEHFAGDGFVAVGGIVVGAELCHVAQHIFQTERICPDRTGFSGFLLAVHFVDHVGVDHGSVGTK